MSPSKKCVAVNGKAPIIGREKVRNLVSRISAGLRVNITNILKGKHWSGTTDHCSKTMYTTGKGKKMYLGIFQKQGRAKRCIAASRIYLGTI
jgi:hypothetical protein